MRALVRYLCRTLTLPLPFTSFLYPYPTFPCPCLCPCTAPLPFSLPPSNPCDLTFFSKLTQSKLTPDDDVKKNFAKLWYYVDEVFNTLEDTKTRCPRPLRTIYAAIFSAAKAHFPGDDEVMYTAVSGFLFLRYFVPAVMVAFLSLFYP